MLHQTIIIIIIFKSVGLTHNQPPTQKSTTSFLLCISDPPFIHSFNLLSCFFDDDDDDDDALFFVLFSSFIHFPPFFIVSSFYYFFHLSFFRLPGGGFFVYHFVVDIHTYIVCLSLEPLLYSHCVTYLNIYLFNFIPASKKTKDEVRRKMNGMTRWKK